MSGVDPKSELMAALRGGLDSPLPQEPTLAALAKLYKADIVLCTFDQVQPGALGLQTLPRGVVVRSSVVPLDQHPVAINYESTGGRPRMHLLVHADGPRDAAIVEPMIPAPWLLTSTLAHPRYCSGDAVRMVPFAPAPDPSHFLTSHYRGTVCISKTRRWATSAFCPSRANRSLSLRTNFPPLTLRSPPAPSWSSR